MSLNDLKTLLDHLKQYCARMDSVYFVVICYRSTSRLNIYNTLHNMVKMVAYICNTKHSF